MGECVYRAIAQSSTTIPIPGIRTVAQVEDNAGAMRFGPLTADQMHQIDELLQRSAAVN
ncbi:MAG: aldo/keto reductase [Anaerolineae bacterium]|nr:aldo/keto reductase [Anaerolineae bacterium]